MIATVWNDDAEIVAANVGDYTVNARYVELLFEHARLDVGEWKVDDTAEMVLTDSCNDIDQLAHVRIRCKGVWSPDYGADSVLFETVDKYSADMVKDVIDVFSSLPRLP